MVEEGTTSPEKSTAASGPSCEASSPGGIFHNFGSLLRPLELVPASRERSGSHGVASPYSPWRLHIESKGDSNSSASVSSICVDQ